MPIRTYNVQGTEMRLCSAHATTVQNSELLSRVPGAAWTCRICTIHRRLTGEALDSVSKVVNGHVVTRTPLGATYCDCSRWRFQRLPPNERTCPHIQVAFPS